MTQTASLETRKLSRSFGSNPVISGVDFILRPGDRRALIGPNGAGKTTFVNLLTGRLRASAGKVLFDGQDITQLGEARRIRLGIGRTFQITSLFPAMTVRENVFLAVAECEGIAGRPFRIPLSQAASARGRAGTPGWSQRRCGSTSATIALWQTAPSRNRHSTGIASENPLARRARGRNSDRTESRRPRHYRDLTEGHRGAAD